MFLSLSAASPGSLKAGLWPEAAQLVHSVQEHWARAHGTQVRSSQQAGWTQVQLCPIPAYPGKAPVSDLVPLASLRYEFYRPLAWFSFALPEGGLSQEEHSEPSGSPIRRQLAGFLCRHRTWAS